MCAFRNGIGAAPAWAVLVWLLATGVASAHALSAECRLRGGKIEVEAYFDDDTPAGDAKVRLQEGHSPSGRTLAEGRTDKDGRWSCPAPAAGAYLLILDAGAGHLTRVQIRVPEAGGGTLFSTKHGTVPEVMPPAGDSSEVISENASRREFTRLPIGRIFLGLAILTVLGGGLGVWLSRRRARRE